MSYYARTRNYVEIQGRLHEDSLKSRLGGDVQNINDLAEDNFRTYDLISSEGVWSVKSHMGGEGELTESAKLAYQANFEHMLGWNRSVDAVEMDAKALRERLPEGTAMPKVLREGSPQEAADFLRNNSKLGIPEDHVEMVRKNLIDHAREFPETYGLPEQPGEEDLQKLSSRIQGTGLNAADTPALVREQLQQQESKLQTNTEMSKEQPEEKDQEEEYPYRYGY
ncbi:MAG TPA: hypothetical protein PLH64_00350 [Anaerolineaceae bacterium]|nr:hypothetical protein [Anaerolineaceae bacterium]